MRLKSVTISNFRCFKDEVTVPINGLTTLIGRNDAGKSAVLEALEIFFNNDIVKIESCDSCVYTSSSEVAITCEFTELPLELTLDSGSVTTLSDEFLLTSCSTLKIRKVFDCAKVKPTCEVFVLADHPTAPGVDNIMELKERELQAMVKDRGLTAALKGNPGMRRAIWSNEPDLMIKEVAIPVTKPKEDSKRIWDQLEAHLPIFALFQSDRRSQDSDGEIQNPMKAAVAAAIAEVQKEIDQIQKKIEEKTRIIASSTHNALKSLDPNLASELTPQFSLPTPTKWASLFSVNMITDHGISLNKRGSGVRRLVLVSFFKAEAERQLRETSRRSIIYAIEEPETSQHPNNQKILIEAFKEITTNQGSQVLLTTHSPGFASDLPTGGIRYITIEGGVPIVKSGIDIFGEVADALGVVPDSRVRVLVCVEGPTDVMALKCLSRALHEDDESIPDLSVDPRYAFVVLGGSTLQHWVDNHYLRDLGKPEVHIYDSDVAKYADAVSEVNRRVDGSWAVRTAKHEIESYLHPDAIHMAFNINIVVPDHFDADGKTAVHLFAEAYSALHGLGSNIRDSTAKKKLAERAFPAMTATLLDERDPSGEVRGWLLQMSRVVSEQLTI